MANTVSAKKATRKMERKTAVNKSRRTRVRGYLRAVEEAIVAEDQAAASEALRKAQSEMMRAVAKGVYHQNTASRKISRLSKRIKALAA
ncbi:30S ribosomal protein S20 [uncultured Cohaesibacter sp.]|uniref:30S ribosomal protein S20 n=1 Tax=uncultured Cohaesibacter sp. TaxID=1002546 RepID=UPI0029C6F849|nr:30S ribosomal protein S20 [uncultured Cohaesibacter sp.]